MIAFSDFFSINLVTLYVAVGTLILTGWNYLTTYNLSRKKDFQEKLYNLKLEAYRAIIESCSLCYKKIEHFIFIIDDFEDTDELNEWVFAHEKKISGIYKCANELEDVIYKELIVIPGRSRDAAFHIADRVNHFGTNVFGHHYNEAHIVADDIFLLYHDLIELFSDDLGVPEIDSQLQLRIRGRNKSTKS